MGNELSRGEFLGSRPECLVRWACSSRLLTIKQNRQSPIRRRAGLSICRCTLMRSSQGSLIGLGELEFVKKPFNDPSYFPG